MHDHGLMSLQSSFVMLPVFDFISSFTTICSSHSLISIEYIAQAQEQAQG
jgi:hypothetical protein